MPRSSRIRDHLHQNIGDGLNRALGAMEDVNTSLGGVPKAEVDAKKALFAAHGFDPKTVFVKRDAGYLDFRPEIAAKADIKARIESDAGVKAAEARLAAAFEAWWSAQKRRIVQLPKTEELTAARASFMKTFVEALEPLGVLDRFQVTGVVARWWSDVQFDLKTLVARGFEGVVEGWAATITTALEEDGGKTDPLEHKLVKPLMGDFLGELAEAEAKVAELDAQVKAAAPAEEENGEDWGGDEPEQQLSEAELKELRHRLTAAKKTLRGLRHAFAERLEAARAALDPDGARDLVLGILHDGLRVELDRYVAAHRRQIVAAVENWWGKYRVTLGDVEGERDAAKGKLVGFLKGLGYDR